MWPLLGLEVFLCNQDWNHRKNNTDASLPQRCTNRRKLQRKDEFSYPQRAMLKQKDVYQSRETKQQFKRASFGLQDNQARVKENIHNLWESITGQWMTFFMWMWRIFYCSARSIIFISFGCTEGCFWPWTRLVSLWLLCSLPVCIYVGWSGTRFDPVPDYTSDPPPPLAFGSIKPKVKSLGAASWMNLSGFTPHHCVCVWTVPTFDLHPETRNLTSI